MKATNMIKKALSLILVFVLVATLLPMPARAADASRTADTIFFGTDLHGNNANLTDQLSYMSDEPGLVVLGGGYTVDGATVSLSSITEQIHSVYPNADTVYTYTTEDKTVGTDTSNTLSRTGVAYEGEGYYIYALDDADVRYSNNASIASNKFLSWAASTAETGKVIFIMSHMPLHKSAGENAGAITWINALNQVGSSRDIIFLWGQNHEEETAYDTTSYSVLRSRTLITDQGSIALNFTYWYAGYLCNSYSTMAQVNDDDIFLYRANPNGRTHKYATVYRTVPAAHKHSWVLLSSVSATCTETGSVSYICSCGESLTESLAALGHSYTQTVDQEPTCDQAGSATNTCTRCGDSYTETLSATGNHAYTSVTTDPTCIETGSTVHTCGNCGYSFSESIEALGHEYTSVTVNPTCTVDGSITYTCTRCDDNYSEVIKANGEHVITTVTVEPTCTEDGSITYSCGCGFEEVEVLYSWGHEYTITERSATCTEGGTISYLCMVCDFAETVEVEALGHAYATRTIYPTCTEDGTKTRTCGNCGDSTVTVLPALGHDYETVTVEATCTTPGSVTTTCANCGDSTVVTSPALGHSFTYVDEGDYRIYTCDTCSHSYSEKTTVDLIYKKAIKFSSDKGYVIGVYSGTTCYALTHSNNQISAVKIKISNGKITSDVTDDMLWNYSGSKLSYEDNGTTYYLYCGTGSSTVSLSVSSTLSSTVSFSSSRLKVGSYYLRYTGGTIKGNKSSSTTYIFEETIA